jgi:hypothetical protein
MTQETFPVFPSRIVVSKSIVTLRDLTRHG